MNRRLIFWIALGVAGAHGALFWWLGNSSPLPKRTHVPRPTFTAASASYIDAATGGKMVVQEFTVSTDLRDDVRLASPENGR